MINPHKVFSLLCDVANLDVSKEDEYMPFCVIGARSVETRLKKGVDHSDPRLIYAAAAQANYQLALFNASSINASAESVKVGDVSISRSLAQEAEIGRQFRDEAFKACADLMTAGSFYFSGV